MRKTLYTLWIYTIITATALLLRWQYYKIQLDYLNQEYQLYLKILRARQETLEAQFQYLHELAAAENLIFFLSGFLVGSIAIIGFSFYISTSSNGDDSINKISKTLEYLFNTQNNVPNQTLWYIEQTQLEMLSLTERIRILQLQFVEIRFKLLQISPSSEDSYNLFNAIIQDNFDNFQGIFF